MRHKIALYALLCLFCAPAIWAQQTTANDNADLRQQVEQMQKALADLQQRLAAQEAKSAALPAAPVPAAGTAAPAPAAEGQAAPTPTDLQAQINDLDDRVQKTEVKAALDRLNFGGDYRYEVHSLYERIPAHFDGMQLQNALVRTVFCANATSFGGASGCNPFGQLSGINGYISGSGNNYAAYQQFLNMLQQTNFTSPTGGNFRDGYSFLQAQVAGFKQMFGTAGFNAFQQALLAQIGTVAASKYQNQALQTSRLRLDFGAKMTDNTSFQGRLAMYKVFGDSTGVQVFNGQPTSVNIDGTTATVPNSDILRVERAFFNWSHIADTPLYLSIGRRPSTEGPPLNLRQDEPRGGTPSGSLIDFQFDGITMGYHLGENTTLRVCYGQGYDSGFGNGPVSNGLSDTHFIGVNADIWNTDKTLIQATYAHAFDVTDGFDGLTVFQTNPLTGETGLPPAVLRFTPDRNVGGIDMAGLLVQQRVGPFDVFVNGNWDGLRPNGSTGPFGGLASDPFSIPTNHDGWFVYAGARYNLPNNKTRIGFEYNHGSKYWFNFTQAQDDIIAPKTATRGDVYEAYITHRINKYLIAKGDYIRYNAQWSGSGWDVGAPQKLSATPVLGFPTFNSANMGTFSMIARF
jgi:hypothetical protein